MGDFILTVASIIIAVGAAVTALGFLLKKGRVWLLDFLEIETTPGDVKDLLEEVHYGVSFLVSWVLKGETEEDLDPAVVEALQILTEAGYDLNFGSNNGN
jgi:hypothetical protein